MDRRTIIEPCRRKRHAAVIADSFGRRQAVGNEAAAVRDGDVLAALPARHGIL